MAEYNDPDDTKTLLQENLTIHQISNIYLEFSENAPKWNNKQHVL